MKRILRAIALAGLASIAAQPCAADEPKLGVSLKSEAATQTSTLLTIGVTEGNARAIAFFSEPSHSLLAVLYDNRPELDPQGTAWFRNEIGAASSPHLMGLPIEAGVLARVQTIAKPAGDHEIGLRILRRELTPDGKLWTHTGRIRTGWPIDFSFVLGSFVLNCGSGPCGDSITCGNPKPGQVWGTCCLETTGSCGQCGKAHAYCGSHFCEEC